jgi:hypothetical protein
MTQGAIATLLSLNRSTLHEWGMPSKDGSDRFSAVDSLEFFLSRKFKDNDDAERYNKAKADDKEQDAIRKQIANGKELDSIADIEFVHEELAKRQGIFRKAVDAVQKMDPVFGPQAVAILNEAVDSVLSELPRG